MAHVHAADLSGGTPEQLVDVVSERYNLPRAVAEEVVARGLSAAAVRRRTRDRTRRVAALTYSGWLQEASPELDWNQPFHRYVCAHIDQIEHGELTQLAIFCPPRLGKSEMVTVRLPVRWLEKNPRARVIVGAYNQTLAKLFTAQALKLYRSRNPDMIEKETEEEWSTTAGGSVFAVGVGSGVTGRGADLIIIDDPVKSHAEANSAAYQLRCWNWYLNDLLTRRNRLSKTPVILIQTRWHDLDLAGRILADDAERGLWTVLKLPALALEDDPLGRAPGESLWEARLPAVDLEELTRTPGFEALYQQDPAPAEGALFKEEWFWYDTVEPAYVVSRVRFWDTAATQVNPRNNNPDFTVGLRMALLHYPDGRVRYAVEDIFRIRAEPGARDDAMDQVIAADGPEVLQAVEEGGSGDKSITHGIRTRHARAGIQVLGVKSKLDKIVRSTNVRGDCQLGKVFLTRGRWNREFLHEVLRFPFGAHDDQVDALSGAHEQLFIHSLTVTVR